MKKDIVVKNLSYALFVKKDSVQVVNYKYMLKDTMMKNHSIVLFVTKDLLQFRIREDMKKYIHL
jgi:hypothetical protein